MQPTGAAYRPLVAPARSTLRLLDGFEYRSSGEVLHLPASCERVLAFLALQRRAVRRQAVAFALWLDNEEMRALANLRSALWRLRGQAADAVQSENGLIQLNPKVEVDYVETLDRMREVAQGADAVLIESVLFTPSELLPDWYQDWVIAERERFRQIRLHALEAASRGFRSRGLLAEAVYCALAAVMTDPFRESAQRELIATYLAEGNMVQAVRAYDSFRSRLRLELGIEPSTRLNDLVASLGPYQVRATAVNQFKPRTYKVGTLDSEA